MRVTFSRKYLKLAFVKELEGWPSQISALTFNSTGIDSFTLNMSPMLMSIENTFTGLGPTVESQASFVGYLAM